VWSSLEIQQVVVVLAAACARVAALDAGGIAFVRLGYQGVMERDAALANITTFGVEDLARERAFYDELGWTIVFEADDFVVFEFGSALFALFPLEKLAADSRARPERRHGGIRSSIIVTVAAPEHVDELAQRAERAGGTVTKPPTEAEFFTGRDAYFADPEGNYWEIAYSPRDNPVTAAARRAANRPS
jgi:predicted lactoylglutathione lyase